MTRLEAIRVVLHELDPSVPVIASLGHPAYDLFAVRDRPTNFYTWGSMGLASSIGLGLAMARPSLPVIVFDGDGSLLMNLGSLATIGWRRPQHLTLLVWDNGSYATTGGQPSATRHGADLEAAAKALGIERAVTVRSETELAQTLTQALREAGPWMIVGKVEESAPTAKPPLDCVFIKHRFMEALGHPESSTTGSP